MSNTSHYQAEDSATLRRVGLVILILCGIAIGLIGTVAVVSHSL